ncbi:hypothetical protein [Roseateles aquatilis]|nr:hypothetical protein [Roseateles aquatilis]
MLVYALRLRRAGVKLTPVEVRGQTPLLGNLAFRRSFYEGRDDRGPMVCLLTPQRGECGWHVELLNAQVLRIEPRGMLIAGEEDEWVRKKRTSHRQAIWAWPAGAAPQTAPPAGSTLESVKFLAALEALV